jgi:hypothetical protein
MFHLVNGREFNNIGATARKDLVVDSGSRSSSTIPFEAQWKKTP